MNTVEAWKRLEPLFKAIEKQYPHLVIQHHRGEWRAWDSAESLLQGPPIDDTVSMSLSVLLDRLAQNAQPDDLVASLRAEIAQLRGEQSETDRLKKEVARLEGEVNWQAEYAAALSERLSFAKDAIKRILDAQDDLRKIYGNMR